MSDRATDRNQSPPPASAPNDGAGDPKQQPDTSEGLREEVEEALGDLIPPDPRRGEAVERIVRVIQAEAFGGPLPHPRHLAAYEQIQPGLVDRIVRMAEVAQERHEARYDRIVEWEYGDRRWGMVCGIVALVVLVVCGTMLFLADQPAAGSALFGAAVLGTIVTSFVRGRGDFTWPWQREKEKKADPPAKS